MMKKNKLLALGFLAIATLTLAAGCSQQTPPTDRPVTHSSESTRETSTISTSTTASSQTTNNKTNPLSEITLSLAEAIEIFQEQHPQVDITAIDLDTSFKQWFYEIEGVNDTHEFKLEIDAVTKEINKKPEELLDQDEANGVKRQEDQLDLKNLATIEEISQLAEKNATGVVTDFELSQERGVTYWEVKLKDGSQETTVTINAQTKDILAVEKDD